MNISYSLMIIIVCLFISLTLITYALLKSTEKKVRAHQIKLIHRWSKDFSKLFIFVNSQTIVWLYFTSLIFLPALVLIIFKEYLFAVISAILVAAIPSYIIKCAKKRRLVEFDEQFPDSLMQISGSLKSGSSLLNAIELLSENSIGPVAQEYGLVVREYRMGTNVEQALRNIEKRVPSSHLGLMVTTTTIAQETGGNLAQSLERLAASSRQQILIDKKIKALTSQGKLQGIVIGLLPVVIGLILSQIEPKAMAALFQTWLGYGTLILVISLETLGLYFIKKVVSIDV